MVATTAFGFSCDRKKNWSCVSEGLFNMKSILLGGGDATTDLHAVDIFFHVLAGPVVTLSGWLGSKRQQQQPCTGWRRRTVRKRRWRMRKRPLIFNFHSTVKVMFGGKEKNHDSTTTTATETTKAAQQTDSHTDRRHQRQHFLSRIRWHSDDGDDACNEDVDDKDEDYNDDDDRFLTHLLHK